ENELSVKWVQPFVSKRVADANLVVVEAIRNTASDGLVLRDAIVVHNQDGSFTPEIKKVITKNKEEGPKKEKYYFYCLLCNDGRFYGGLTNDLAHRLKEHNEGKGRKYTKKKEEGPKKEKYYFYCLLCNDGSFYGGFTNDLAHRLKMHNEGKGAKYTKTRRPVKMIYHEEFDDKKLALKREDWFKHHSRKW